jgi:hypothetical protein
VHAGEPLAERQLSGRAVDPGHRRVGDERRGPVARDERAEELERADADVDARGGEDDVVEVVRDEVGRRLVERAPALVQLREAALVLRERPCGAPGTLPRRLERDVNPDRPRVSAQRLACPRRFDRPAAESEHPRVRRLEHRDRPFLLDLAEPVLAVAREQLGDRVAVLLGNELVDVDERQADQLGGLPAERRLARAHEADQREVAVHSIRSR